MHMVTVNVNPDEAGGRLDKYLTAQLPELSRSRVQQLLAQGCIRLGEATITDAGKKVKPAEVYCITIPDAAPTELVASDVALNVIYEDEHLLVIDKPAGMTVHPAPGHADDTLVNALLSHCGNSLSGIGGVMRPGIVHRIDKDTSGLLVVAKHDAAHRHLSAQLADRSLSREYICIVKGMPLKMHGTVDAPIGRSPSDRKKMAVRNFGGRDSVTHYRVSEIFGRVASLVECKLETGRTHQIRVHMAHIGHPLIGDQVYGRKTMGIDLQRQALHAAKLRLIHPTSGMEMEFVSPLPEDIKQLIKQLKSLDN